MIKTIKLKNFRKFKELQLETANQIIIFSGPNASGKTSVLESIYLTSTSKSHRTLDLTSLILNEEDFSIIEIEDLKKYKVILSKEGKRNYINNVEYSKLSDFIGNLKVVMFSPHDLELIQGSKGVRRRFLDLEISLLDKTYLRAITAYKKILKERNEILKKYNQDNELILKVLTTQLIEEIKCIYEKRIKFIDSINRYLNIITKKLECENIKLIYLPSYDINNIVSSFENKKNYDILSKTTNIGTHRDDFKIEINDLDAYDYASEGQKRTIVLAIKLALKELYYNQYKIDPILLLDDIFAALDNKRINHIMAYIKNQSQTFITTTSIFSIPDELLKNAKVIRL